MYVIIGGSAAALGCIEGIRQTDKTGQITLITDETMFHYARPLISYLLEGKTTEETMCYRPLSFYQDNGVAVRSGVMACAIDTAAKKVLLSDGSMVAYDKLLLATGSRPFIPPISGYETVEKAFTFMTLESAKALAAALTPQSRVLIVGAGLTGVKCAEGIAGRCAQVTIVDLAPRVLPAVLDDAGAALIQSKMEAHGVSFYLNNGVRAFQKNSAVLNTGETLTFDVLVMAVGVRPNTQLLAALGAQVDCGVLINYACETSLPDIYAAGDCAQGYDAVSGTRAMLPLWSNAVMQGQTAGVNMAGGQADYTQGIALNACGVFGLHMVTAGSYDGESYVEQKDGAYKRLITGGGVLKGVIMVGDVARAGIYTNLIRKRKPLSEIDFDLIKQSPQLMAFSKKDRENQLAKEV